MATKTMYKLVGSGVLKKRVPVEVDIDLIRANEIESVFKKCASELIYKLNKLARDKGYYSDTAMATYAIPTNDDTPNPFYEEAIGFVRLRNSSWSKLLSYKARVLNDSEELLTVNEIMTTIVPPIQLP